MKGDRYDMSAESIERRKQEARDYEEIGDYFSEIVENNSDRYSFEWGVATSANAKMEVYDKEKEVGYIVKIEKIQYGENDEPLNI